MISKKLRYARPRPAEGAEASAIIYSLVETAKACQISPYDYLLQCLKRAPDLLLCELPEHVSLLFPENFKK